LNKGFVMENIKSDNAVIIDKLKELKNKLIDVHILNTSNNNSVATLSEIAKLNEVNDELKETLILLHTNLITGIKFNSENSLKTYNALIDVTTEIIIKQNELIDKIKENEKNGIFGALFKKTKSILSDNKIAFIVVATTSLVTIVGLFLFFPEETQKTFNELKELFTSFNGGKK
jgi:hypothetical protein